jgi:hypothetical protein
MISRFDTVLERRRVAGAEREEEVEGVEGAIYITIDGAVKDEKE